MLPPPPSIEGVLEEQPSDEERRRRILSQKLVEFQKTGLKLQKYSLGGIRLLLLVVIFIDVACLIIGIFICSFSYVTSGDRLDGVHVKSIDHESRKFVLYGEAVTRTVACFVIMMTLFVFTVAVINDSRHKKIMRAEANQIHDMLNKTERRVIVDAATGAIRSAMETEDALTRAAIRFVQNVGGLNDDSVKAAVKEYSHFRENLLIIIWLTVIAMNPTTSVYGIVVFWTDLTDSFKSYLEQFQVVHQVRSSWTGSTYQASIVLTSIFATGLHFFFYGMVHFQDRRRMMHLETKRTKEQPIKDDEEFLQFDDFQRAHMNEFEGFNDKLQVGYRYRIRKAYEAWQQRIGAYLEDLQENVLYGLELKFVLPLLAYLGLSIGFGLGLQFNPSFVPVVSVFTLIRVCSMNATLVTAVSNFTIISNEGDEFLVNVESQVSNQFSICSNYQPESIRPFRITVVVSVLVALDLYFLYLLWHKSKNTRRSLALLAYDSTRSTQLGFAYFRMLTWVSSLFVFTLATVITWVEPISSYILGYVSVTQTRLTPRTRLYHVDLEVTPFHQVGMGPLVYGFGTFYMILAAYMAQLAFGFIPYRALKSESSMQLAMETDVAILGKMLKEERDLSGRKMKPMKSTQSSAAHSKQGSQLFGLNGISKYLKSETPLEEQIESRILVLETTVLLYHFMSLSYDLCDVVVPEGQAGLEPYQKLIEDPRYQLCLYARDVVTDTHAFVFYSADRVIVSFRGSVSFKNYKTDWDSSEVESEHGRSVQPLLDDELNLAYSRKIASRKALVHGGFVKAYESVRERICEHVEGLLTDPEKKRCVFVTGHSLGAGLAVVCAFDLGVRLRIPPNRISLVTWGCPKVGTFSFVTRVHRIVPCSHRIATANDVITQLPFGNPLSDWTLGGWHHVGTEVILLSNGNMVVRPSPIERFMMHKLKTSVVAHFRLNYAVALAAWIIRTNPDYSADWWLRTINSFVLHADLTPLPKELREELLWDLRRPGAPYVIGSTLVRDQAIDTSSVPVESADTNEALKARQALIEQLLAAREDEVEFLRSVKQYLSDHDVAVTESSAELLRRPSSKDDSRRALQRSDTNGVGNSLSDFSDARDTFLEEDEDADDAYASAMDVA